jgi:dipeptidyl aminopeptidase/acylaminoacyl peptidase
MHGRAESLLILVTGGNIQLWPFDAVRLTIAGDQQTMALAAADASLHYAAMLGVSPGVLAFASTRVPTGFHAASIDVDGTNLSIRPAREILGQARLSPSGTHVARTFADPVTGDSDVWVEGLAQPTRVRITTSRDLDLAPVWSPDGRHLAYRSGPFGASNLSIASSDGTGVVNVLPCPGEPCHPTDWSPDGRWLAVNARGDVWRVEIEGGSASPLLSGPFVEYDGRISPDGRAIAYVSTESGRSEVYIRTLSAPVRRVVASSGGNQPVWRRDGGALFYVSLDHQLHEVTVQRGQDGSPAIGASVKLPVGRFGASHIGITYDVSPDARRVYFHHAGDPATPREIGVVLDWSGW